MTTCRKTGNRWTARYTWTDAVGERHWKRVSERLKEDCQRRLADAQLESRLPVERRTTLAAFSAAWLDEVRRSRSAGTWTAHEIRLRKHVLPDLGHRTLASLSPRDVHRWLASLDGMAQSTRADALATLHAVLNAAVRQGLLPASPAARIAVRRPSPSGDGFTAGEIRSIAAACAHASTRQAVLVAASTGLRLGELLGLRREDIDFERGLVRVERARAQAAGGDITGPPKTAASRRTIAVGPVTLEVLREAVGGRDGWVFSGRDGSPLPRKTFQHRWAAARERAGVRRLPFHALRHSCATMMLEAGVNPKVVQEVLGHGSIEITMRTYAHLTDDVRWEAAGIAEGFMHERG